MPMPSARLVALLIVPAAAVLAAAMAFARPQDGRAPGPAPEVTADQAQRVIERTADAYRRAPALKDIMRLEVKMPPRRPQRVQIAYAFGAGTDSVVDMPGMTAVASRDRVFVTRDDAPDRYLEAPLSRDLVTTLAGLLGGDPNLPVQFDMRSGHGVDAYVEALGIGILQGGRLSGYALVDDEDGRPVHKVSLTGDNGDGDVIIDSKTNLIRRVTIRAVPGQAGAEGQSLTARMRFEPQVLDESDGLVAFDASDRKAVASFADLAQRAVGVGEPAPDFTLADIDGREVTLSDLRGTVVVLDFWATWCGPCKRALPSLQKFDDWARASNQDVAVFAVDTFERGKTSEDIRKRSIAYWTSQKYTMENLFDLDSAVTLSYGIQSIPTTVIVAPDGRVANIHRGYNAGMFEQLKKDVGALLDGS